MECIEINAGEYYLRGIRSDDRVDDIPALKQLRPDIEITQKTIASYAAGWTAGDFLSWAVCKQTEPDLYALIEVAVEGNDAIISVWAEKSVDPGGAVESVSRFLSGALELTVGS